MDLLHRYRSLTVLVFAILAQLVLLAYQVKTNQDTRLIRVWAITAVTPLARVLEGIRGNTTQFVGNYVVLSGVQAENRKLKDEVGKLKLENQYLKAELSTADRAQALAAFQKRTPSKTLAARVIGTSTGTNSKVVFLDRGSSSGVFRGMAIVTPDGIVGKVIASYPTAAQVQLITDPGFAVGVISQKNRVVGTLKGQGRSDCIVDYVQIEQQVDVGEWFYTSGDDRIFPKGLPVGQASVVRSGKTFKDIYLNPSGFQRGLEEVLVIVEGVHQRIPEDPTAAVSGPVKMLPPPPGEGQSQSSAPAGASKSLTTDADRLKERYREIGESQSHKFGEGMTAPNFNKGPAPPRVTPPGGAPPSGTQAPPAVPPKQAPVTPTPAAQPKTTAAVTP